MSPRSGIARRAQGGGCWSVQGVSRHDEGTGPASPSPQRVQRRAYRAWSARQLTAAFVCFVIVVGGLHRLDTGTAWLGSALQGALVGALFVLIMLAANSINDRQRARETQQARRRFRP